MRSSKAKGRVVDRIIRSLSSIQFSLGEFRGRSESVQSEFHSNFTSLIALSRDQPSSYIRNNEWRAGKEKMKRKLHQDKDNAGKKRKKFVQRLLKREYQDSSKREYLTKDLLLDKDVKSALLNNRRQFAFGSEQLALNQKKLWKSPPGSFIYDYKPEKPSPGTNTYVLNHLARIFHNHTYRNSPKRQNVIIQDYDIRSPITSSSPNLLKTLPVAINSTPEPTLPRVNKIVTQRSRHIFHTRSISEVYNIKKEIKVKNVELISMKRKLPKLMRFNN